jgi:hypothetical protein
VLHLHLLQRLHLLLHLDLQLLLTLKQLLLLLKLQLQLLLLLRTLHPQLLHSPLTLRVLGRLVCARGCPVKFARYFILNLYGDLYALY